MTRGLVTVLAALLHEAAGFALHTAAPRGTFTPYAAARAPAPIAEETMPASASSIVPLQDYVLVDLQSVPSATEVGILLPTVYYDFEEKNEEVFVKPKPRAGTVVAVGPGRRSGDGCVIIPMPPLTVGQKVVVGADKGEKVVLDGEAARESTHFLFRVEELFGYCEA